MSRQVAEKEPEVELDPIPNVEWWDARILVDGAYPEGLADGSSSSAAADGTRGLVRGKVTALVEHPVPIQPPAEPEPPPPRPLMLTAKVRSDPWLPLALDVSVQHSSAGDYQSSVQRLLREIQAALHPDLLQHLQS